MSTLKRICLIVFLVFATTSNAGEWYSGGTLARKNALSWQEATLANKIASSSDFVAITFQKKMLNPTILRKIKGINDIAPYAIQLAICIDAATKKNTDHKLNKKLYTNQKVSSMAGLCMVSMGWVK